MKITLIYREDSVTAEEAALKGKILAPITLEMLSKGGFYDMPMSVGFSHTVATVHGNVSWSAFWI